LGPSRLADAEADCQAAKAYLDALIDEQTRKGIRNNPDYLSLLSRTHANARRIHVARGDTAKAQDSLAKAAECMKQATDIDPARVRDRAFLDAVKAGIDQVQRPVR
jgi:hypothetical protein